MSAVMRRVVLARPWLAMSLPVRVETLRIGVRLSRSDRLAGTASLHLGITGWTLIRRYDGLASITGAGCHP